MPQPMMATHARRWFAGLLFSTGAVAMPSPPPSVDAFCDTLATRVNGLSAQTCRNAGLHIAGRSVDNRPLLQRDFSETRRGARRILLIGAIHGDEPAASKLVFDWMRRIDAQTQRGVHWRVAPCVNPDGIMAPKPTRTNAHGVDLNRNFPSADWSSQALRYWATRTRSDPRRYPGIGPASEPETRWLVAQIQEFKPDAIVSVHAPYGVLDYDGPREPPRRLGFLHLQQLGFYPGSLGGYAGHNLRLPVLTLELPEANRPPSDIQSAQLWKDLLSWVDRHLPPSSAGLAVTNGR